MDYKHKYNKYKTKYIKLLNGGAKEPFCTAQKLKDYLKDTLDDWNYILPTELHKQIKSGEASKYFLLDIRKPKDYDEGHIKDTTNIFWLDLLEEENLKKLPKDKKIVIICYLGHTASQALVLLKLLGYDVIALKFGMGKPPSNIPVKGWLNLDFPVVKSR